MKQIYQPLRSNWHVDEDSAVPVVDQITERVDTEDMYAHCKGYPLIRSEDIVGRIGKPLAFN